MPISEVFCMFGEKTIKEIESGGGRESITAEKAFCELAENTAKNLLGV